MSTPQNQLPPNPPSGLSATEIESMVKSFMARGETESRVATLLSENYQYREKLRQSEAEVTQLKARVPAEGSLVLAGDELKVYNAFVALKLKPEEISTLQTQLTTLQGEVGTAKRKESLLTAAAAEGYDPVVLGTLMGDKDLVTEPIEEEVDGKKTKVDRAFILNKVGDVTNKERLSTHVETHHAKFLPSLKAEDESTANGGTKFPRQRASQERGKATQPSASKSYINKKYKTPPAQGAAK